ncbi:hypothetical protein FB645_000888 [Coemansia sp. IMI 203386]|nr:hypothetical protein FB645_000888 [Coemansia sp. IMI 203386]
MRAAKKQTQTQRAGSLKSFVRVGKASDVPAPKDALATTPARMTRSKSAALTKVVEQPTAEETEAAIGTRKRKLVAETPSSPAKKNARTATAPASTNVHTVAAPASGTPTTSRVKKATTISAYFSPTPKEAVEEESVMPKEEAAKENDDAVDVKKGERKAELDTRASALLGRLRGRKRAAPDVEPGVRLEETRAIQEDLRDRRIETATAAAMGETAAEPGVPTARFAAGQTPSAEDVRQRELRRQFVSIQQPADGWALPRTYRKLEDLFQGLEHTVMFGGLNSHSRVIYHRVRKSVEVMAKRTFGWRELGQIVALYPEAYGWTAVQVTHEGRMVRSVELMPKVEGARLAIEMEARRKEFRKRLVARVDAAHRAFLVARGYADEDVARTSGWHPAFDVEDTPDIAPVTMPPPATAAVSHNGAPAASFDREKLKHLLGRASEKVADKVAEKSAEKVAEKSTEKAAPLPTPTDSPVLTAATPKPVSKAQSLLERIRAKQRAKEAQKQSLVPSVPASTRTMHSRLPGILEALSFMFYAERKSVLPFFYVVDKIVELKGLDKADASAHLVALGSFVPEWCAVLQEQGDVLPDGVEPTAGARIKVIRSVSMQEAKTQLLAKIAEQAQ